MISRLRFNARNRYESKVTSTWHAPLGGTRICRLHALAHHGDKRGTPHWFPSHTTSGSIREDRLVQPIPPGTHWQDVKPILLPAEAGSPKLEARSPKQARNPKPQIRNNPAAVTNGGLRFAVAAPRAPEAAKPKREPKPKVKNDPKHVAAARELRDRFLEHVNADPSGVLGEGKYDVSRRVDHRDAERERRLLAG